jgi:hypothetical protein
MNKILWRSQFIPRLLDNLKVALLIQTHKTTFLKKLVKKMASPSMIFYFQVDNCCGTMSHWIFLMRNSFRKIVIPLVCIILERSVVFSSSGDSLKDPYIGWDLWDSQYLPEKTLTYQTISLFVRIDNQKF